MNSIIHTLPFWCGMAAGMFLVSAGSSAITGRWGLSVISMLGFAGFLMLMWGLHRVARLDEGFHDDLHEDGAHSV